MRTSLFRNGRRGMASGEEEPCRCRQYRRKKKRCQATAGRLEAIAGGARGRAAEELREAQRRYRSQHRLGALEGQALRLAVDQPQAAVFGENRGDVPGGAGHRRGHHGAAQPAAGVLHLETGAQVVQAVHHDPAAGQQLGGVVGRQKAGVHARPGWRASSAAGGSGCCPRSGRRRSASAGPPPCARGSRPPSRPGPPGRRRRPATGAAWPGRPVKRSAGCARSARGRSRSRGRPPRSPGGSHRSAARAPGLAGRKFLDSPDGNAPVGRLVREGGGLSQSFQVAGCNRHESSR